MTDVGERASQPGANRGGTLLDVLLDAAGEAPGQVIVHVRGNGGERVVTLAELRDESLQVAGGYRAAGLAPGGHVLLLADRSDDFQLMFWGALAAGLIPVPLAPEARRVVPVWEALDRPPVVVDEAGAALLDELPGSVCGLRLAGLRDGGTEPAGSPALLSPSPDDVAFLQFSSGSTGAPKGVELTHAAVLANLEQIRTAAAITPDDVVASWMPYFHDMGLIGTHLAPLAARAKQVKLGPLSFAKRPALWFEAAARHRATLLSAANFALALAVRRVPDATLARLDLSCVRLLLVGAEPIAAAVWRDFARKTRPAGLDARAPQPVYGLAEATLAVTFPPLGEVAEPLALDREALGRGRAVDAAPGGNAVELMDVGFPLPGCAVRVVGERGDPLGDRRVGRIEVRGPQVARGYHRSPEATAAAFSGGWLRTGDMGFLRDGRLCVTGRHKDVLFVNGRTFHATDLEEVAAGTPGLPSGRTAVVGSTDPVGGGERVVVFVQWPRPPRATVGGVLARVAARVGEALSHDDVRVLPLPAGAFPRTTSGKLRRALMRERYEAGAYAGVEERAMAARAAGATGSGSGSAESRGSRPGTTGSETAGHGGVGPGSGTAGAGTGVEAPRLRSTGAEAAPPGSPPPRSRREAERLIAGLWARVLGRPAAAIGPRDRFPAIGGSSLKAMEVLAELEDTFGITVPPAVLRDHDTVAALAEYVLAASGQPPAPAQEQGAPRPVAGDAPTAPLAITGMACRFPGADTPEAFWDRLASGHDAVTGVPADRWAAPSDRAGRRGAFLGAPADFDADCFGIDEREARATDPQARLFLELAHEALERAGYAGPRRRDRRIGVFAAVGESGYRELLARAHGEAGLPAAALAGNLPNLIAARVAQSLDLTGPALAVDTACSSALVALHLAARSLRTGECDIAVVGGVNLLLTPTAHQLLTAAQALSPTGRSRAFSAAADGFVPGEGGAALVLTRLGDARRADDPVLALLRGTAVNNDGRSLSLLAPNPLRQREVIAAAYRDAEVDPDTVSYVEAHGTGTPIGDPVEVRSLAHTFAPRSDGEPRLLGSVKTNYGHLLNAAGMPGLLKVVLALAHRRLPPSLHHTPPAPGPDLARAGFAVVTEHRAWTAPGPLVAGVNAFGFGGTNAHAILEEAPPRPVARPPASPADGPYLLTLSARSAPALREAVSDLAAYLRDRPELNEGDVCAGASTARDDGPHRLAVVAHGDLAERLTAGPAGTVARGRPRLVFLLPGQGSQRPGQGRALYESAPVFRDVLDEASALTGPVDGRSLADWCLDPDVSPAALARTEVAQPLLVAFGVALARQLQAWGVLPDAVAGHSVGEIAAGCVAGALTLGDAVRFAAERGRLMAGFTAPGAMAAVRGGEGAVAGLVADADGALCVAAVNGPTQVVLAGTPEAVERAVAKLIADGVPARRLEVSRAFHSPMMRPALDAIAAAAGALVLRPPAVPLISTVTAEWQPPLTPDHWREQTVRPVRFAAAVERLLDDGYDTFVELGPGVTLPGPVQATATARARATCSDGRSAASADPRSSAPAGPVTGPSADPPAGPLADPPTSPPIDPLAGPPAAPTASSPPGPPDSPQSAPEAGVLALAALRGDTDGGRALLETAGRLWARGAELDRSALDVGRARVAVPTYPFQRRTYWPEPPARPLLHRLVWDDAPPATGRAPRAVRLAGPDSPLALALADRLTDHGVTVYRDAGAPPAGAPHPDTVLLLAGPSGDPDTVAQLDTAQHSAFTALRDLLPLLDDRDGHRSRSATAPSPAPRLLVVTEDAHATGAAPERLRPAQSLLTGLTLALREELPGLTAHSVDLSSLDGVAARLDALERELAGRGEPGPAGTVAWRGDRRLSRTPVPVASPPPSPPLPPDGVYLITGGAGGVGAALARDLAGRGRPTLVLAGRSAHPPPGLPAELRALGATVEYRRADVSVEADADALLADLPPLDVVFHAAGVVRPGTLRAKTPDELAQGLAAKTRGSLLLARALRRRGHRPALCVAFSSVASVLPGLAGGLGDYAAGNAFLDTFAAAERAAGRPWLALNFAAFAGTGLAAGPGARAAVEARGVRALSTEEALRALHTACGVGAAQLLVADLAEAVRTPVPGGSQAPGPVSAAPRVTTAPATATGPVPSDADTATILRRLLAGPLHRPPSDIADDEPFLSMGLDSLTAVDLVKQLEHELRRPLPTTLFFEHRTIGELTARLRASGTGGHSPALAPDTAEQGAFPLTPVQLAFHTNGRLHRGVTAYGYLRQTIRGPLDTGLLGQSLALLAARHPMLRMRIESGGTGAPRQTVAPPVPVRTWYEIRDLDGGSSLEELEEELCNRPFDLTTGPPVRAVLFRDKDDDSAGPAHLVLVIHHAAADGFSLNVLGEELWSVYTSLSQGRTPSLPPLRTGFADYVAAEGAERSSAEFAEDQRYWRGVLTTARREPLRLPYDGDPDAPPAPPLAVHRTVVDPALTEALRERAAAHGVSLFHLLLAAYTRCLARWSGQSDVAVNVARARRETRLPAVDRLVGPLADTLPVFASVGPDEPVPALAGRLRQAWLESERHARLTSLDLARLLPADGAGPRTVSPAGFSFARFPAADAPGCPVSVHPAAAGTGSAATRLGLLCWETGRALHFSWNFPTRLFDRSTVARLAEDHLDELTALTASAVPDRQRTPERAAPSESGVVPRLCARFRAVPAETAVDTGESTLTYAALDRASAALATRLRASGVTAGDLVGLFTEPGADTVVGVVGILRAGAGWVPLDTAHPAARLADQLARTGARTVVCHVPTLARAEALDGVTLVSAVPAGPPPATAPPMDANAPAAPADPDAIAYVIFTSGSTGRPKAVPITHRSMTNYLDWSLTTFGYRSGDRLAQTASICFDASVRQLLAPLLVGATVVTLPRHLVRDPDALLDHVEQGRITVWSSVPTLWERLLTAAENRIRRGSPPPDLSALRWIHVGGEALSAAHVRRWFDLFGPGQRIANLYGPTEATINATCHLIDTRPGDDVRQLPIGRPVAGTDVEVVAPDGRRCATGETGELLITGTGLSPGYLGEPALTAAAFTERDGRRWYRSGDRARVGPDGLLEFAGRLDDQVKIRGHRVEPGEIEAVLETHHGVARAAVLHRDGRLTAFVEPRSGEPAPDAAGLRAFLAGVLPGPMLPARIRPVGALPLTGTGKIDRSRLAVRPPSARGTAGAPPGNSPPSAPEHGPRRPPATPTERRLARIWSELLDLPVISREDDFFALGGDSILILDVFARLEEEVPVLPRPTVIYTHGTLAALASAVDAAGADRTDTGARRAGRTAGDATGTRASPASRTAGDPSGTDASPAGRTAGDPSGPAPAPPTSADCPAPAPAGLSPFPLTPTQRGFLLGEAIAPGGGSAWLARLRLHGPLRPDHFQRAVDVLVERHPMLRTVFPSGARPPVQQELPPAVRLPVDFETLPSPDLLDERIAAERRRRFEPWAWPLLRLRLLTLAPDEHVLVVHAHHLIGDGYSAALLGRELLAVYDRLGRGEPAGLPPLRATFRDYAALLDGQPPVPYRDPAAEAWRTRLAAPYRQPVAHAGTGKTPASPTPFHPTGFTPGTGRADRQAPGPGREPAADTWQARLAAPYRQPVPHADADADETPASASPFHSTGFTLNADRVGELRRIAAGAGATLYAPLLTAYYRALAALTGRQDLVLGLAVTGRDHALPDIGRLFGPFAAAVPLRPGTRPAGASGPGAPDAPRPSFEDDLRRVAAEVADARMYGGDGVRAAPSGLPLSAQFFFTFLDFSALGPLTGDTLTARWDDGDAELAPPPIGTDVFLAARPAGDRLRVTLRASASALAPASFTAFTDALRTQLTEATARGAARASTRATAPTATRTPRRTTATVLDSALVGYLPSPPHLAAFTGLPPDALPREELRALLFPDAAPRLLEETTTPIGRSGFVCLPLFADELAPGAVLSRATARAVGRAASLGARCVSLAGMIPALTGYGFEVLREMRETGAVTAVTTGHAATAVSVVKTAHAALDATRRDLGDLTVAVVGLGSIGGSSLELLLARARRPPARLLLCDVTGSGPRLKELAESMFARGLATVVEPVESDPELPPAVYEADLVVTAVSGSATVLDIDRLRPGTIVVDDSFPHCFDTARAVDRMRRRRDVLVVGGGLLSVGDSERRLADGLPSAAAAGHAARPWLPGTVASCRLESLLHSAVPGLPLVHGLVDTERARAYWDGVEAAGVRAAPLHLLDHTLTPASLTAFPARRRDAE